ncbi:hypothetical protein [Amycolatopsis sp. NPDC057786]|uniref:protein kinase domain-containing protein n=1 Tax=Amycolatopsis sp. NPDC057786 TaxID=3346250 RepID=UPI0036728BAE
MRAYRLGPKPLGRGARAVVLPAVHETIGVEVAFKRWTSWMVEAVARMQREIEFGRLQPENEHIMPVLDHGLAHDWFVMALAQEHAESVRSLLTDDAGLGLLILAVCAALEAAHEVGWLHRYLKPANLLLLGERWMVAAWGLGRPSPSRRYGVRDSSRAGSPVGLLGRRTN